MCHPPSTVRRSRSMMALRDNPQDRNKCWAPSRLGTSIGPSYHSFDLARGAAKVWRPLGSLAPPKNREELLPTPPQELELIPTVSYTNRTARVLSSFRTSPG